MRRGAFATIFNGICMLKAKHLASGRRDEISQIFHCKKAAPHQQEEWKE
jgi:hypothetical protein